MSSNPLVSIIIPVYNGADYVGEAIRSALRQSYTNTEVIVVDDGSTDNGASRDVAESFGSRIRYVHKPNGGVATALNTGIANMRGQLFSWLSHDDLYRRHKVARQVATWQRFGQPCIVIGDFETMDENRSSLSRADLSRYNLVARPLDAVFQGLINGCALLVPRELFDRAGLFEPGLPTTQDYHLWYRMARLVPFVHCPFADVRQRMHASQGSRHASHLDEASRMFAHLIESTPTDVMKAYDGSELRFLLRIHQILGAYSGLRSYLDSRIRELMRQFRYSAVLDAEGGDPGELVAAIRNWPVPPAEMIVVVHATATRPVGPFRTVECVKPQPAPVLLSTMSDVNEDTVVFLRASRMPSGKQIAGALQALIASDADLAKPGAPATVPELDTLVVRRDMLKRLHSMLEKPDFDLTQTAAHFQSETYAVVDAMNLPAEEEVQSALRGDVRLNYHRGLSASGIGKVLDGMLNPDLPVILFILHSLGGGAHTLLKSLMATLRGKANPLVCYGTPTGEFHLSAGSEHADKGIVFWLPEYLPELVQVLRRSRVARVDIHHTIGYEEHVTKLLDALRVPFDVTVVDYHLVATNPFLCHEDGRFAGDETTLLRLRPLPFLRKASRVIAISRDLTARLRRLCPERSIIPARLWHEYGVQMRHVFAPRIRRGEPLRVAICGDIAAHKGRQTVIDVAGAAAARNLPLHFHVLGEISLSAATVRSTADFLTVHGRYNGTFTEAIGSIAPHVGWIPSQAPETWSYVLTDLMQAGLPVAATAIGAIPERVHGRPYTWLLPWNASTEQWIELFLRLHAGNLAEPPRWAEIDNLPPLSDIYFDEYLKPVRESMPPN